MKIIRHSKISIKQLIAKFKKLQADQEKKAQKAQFMSIVKKVAKLEKEGDEKIVVLRESTAIQG